MLALSLVEILISGAASAQVTNSQERFQDFFATAGYGTAFGAALGAATLPFQENPEKHLRSVAIGASIGFFAGSLLGSYVIFMPSVAESTPESHSPKLTVTPLFDRKGERIQGIQSSWQIAQF
ncbi:hypothetical protein [Pseudobacteriovorax antillogorgiicola]|nr:hypothetical protein [Pseudobacteriovorax antillogorgiicola]